MGVLQRFERRLGGLVEGAFAKVFKGGVEPVEIASALARETDDRRAVSSNRVLVPNDYAVELAAGDYTRLAPYTRELCEELAEMVREHAAEQRYTFVGPVSVRLSEAEDLDVGVFRIRSSVAAADPGAVPGRRAAGRPRPATPGAPRLVISTKPGPDGRAAGGEREYPLDAETTAIGRSVECDIRLNDTGVSRRHGEVRRMPDGQFVYVDLGSTNGSVVNGRAASQVKLVDGDQIELGSTILAFRREEPRGAGAGRAVGQTPARVPPAGGSRPPAMPPVVAPAERGRPGGDPRSAGPVHPDPRVANPPAGYPPAPGSYPPPPGGHPAAPADPYRGDPRAADPRYNSPPPGYPPAPAGHPPAPADPYRGDPRRAAGFGDSTAPQSDAYPGGERPHDGRPTTGRPADPYGGGRRYEDPYGGKEGQHFGGADPRDHPGAHMAGSPPPRAYGADSPTHGASPGYGETPPSFPPADPDDADIYEQETYRPGRTPPAGPGGPAPDDHGW